MVTDDRTTDIKARLQAATANGRHWISGVATMRTKDGHYVSFSCGPDRLHLDMKKSIAEADKDDALIQDAPADIAYLLALVEQLTAERDSFSAKITANVAEIERLLMMWERCTDNKNSLVCGCSKALAKKDAEIHVWRCLLTTLAIGLGFETGVSQAQIGAWIVEKISLAMWSANESGGFADNIDIEAEGDELERMEAAVDRVCDKLHLPRLEDETAWQEIIK